MEDLVMTVLSRTHVIWGHDNQITLVYLSNLITKYNLQEKMAET